MKKKFYNHMRGVLLPLTLSLLGILLAGSLRAQVSISELPPPGSSNTSINSCGFSERVIQVSLGSAGVPAAQQLMVDFNSMAIDYDQAFAPPAAFINTTSGCSPGIVTVSSQYNTGLEITFDLNGLASNCSFQLHYFVRAHCDGPANMTAQYAMPSMAYTSPAFAFQVNHADFGIPVVNGVAECATNTNITNIGQFFNRTITIVNTGAAFDLSAPGNQQILITDQDLCSLTTKFYEVNEVQYNNAGTWTPLPSATYLLTGNTEVITLNEADLLLLAGGNSIGFGQDIEVRIVYRVVRCMCANAETQTLSIAYACDQGTATCATGTAFNCALINNFQNASINILFEQLSTNTCYSPGAVNQMRCTVTNTGSGAATFDLNLFLNANLPQQFTGFSNFSFSGNATAPTLIPGASTAFGCGTAPSSYAFDNALLPAVNGTLIIEWDATTCCPPDDCANVPVMNGWVYNASYQGACQPQVNLPAGSAFASLLTPQPATRATYTYEGVSDVDASTIDPFVAEFNITSPASFDGSVNVNNQRLEIQVVLNGPDLYFINSGLALGEVELYLPIANVTLTPNNITPGTAITCGGLTMIQQLNAFFDNVAIPGGNLLDQNAAGTFIRLNTAILRFKYRATCHCPVPAHTTDMLEVSMYHHPDVSCANACRINLGCTSQILNMHCPGCLRQGIHLLGYDIRRTSFGFQDVNNNSRWEAAAGNPIPIDPAYLDSPGVFVKDRRAMVGDTVQGVLRTSVVIDSQNYGPWLWNGAPTDFGFGLGELTYGRYQTTVTYDMANGHMEPLELIAEIRDVTDLNGIPVLNPLEGNISLWTIRIPGNQISESNPPGSSVFSVNTSMSVLSGWYFAEHGVNLPFTQYRNGMNILWRTTYLVDGNVGPDYSGTSIINLMYLGLHDESGGSLVDPDGNPCFAGFSVPADYTNYCNSSPPPGCPSCMDLQWYCTMYGGNFTMVGYEIAEAFYFGGNNVPANCGGDIDYNYILRVGPVAPGGLAGTNAFPFEFRNWMKMDDINWTLPPTYTQGNALIYQRHCNGNNLFNYTYTAIAPTGTFPNFLYDYSPFYHSGAEPGFTSPGNGMVNTDDDFYIEQKMVLSPSCLSSGIDSSVFTRRFDFAGEGDAAGINATVFPAGPPALIRTWTLTHEYNTPPVLTVSANIPNGIGSQVCWTVVIENTSTNHFANNVWFSIPNFNNGITISGGSAVLGNGTTVNFPAIVPGTTYHLGNLTRDVATATNQVTLTLCGTYTCIPDPEVTICTGWNCAGYPAGDSAVNALCIPVCDTLTVNNTFEPQLNAVLNPPASMYPCSTAVYSIDIQNTAYNTLNDFIVSVNIPTSAGVSYVPGSAALCYPASPGCTYGTAIPITSAPQLLGNTLIWDLNTMIPVPGFVPDGIPGMLSGVSTSDSSHFLFYFEIQTGCDIGFDPSEYLSFTVDAVTNCGDPQTWSLDNNPYLTAVNSPVNNLSLSTNIAPFSNCNTSTQGTLTVNNLSSSPASNCNSIISLTLPPGLSASNISNGGILLGNTITWPPSVVCSPALPGNSSLALTFYLHYNASTPCGTYFVEANIQLVDSMTCATTGGLCYYDESQYSTSDSVIISPPDASFNSVGSWCAGDPLQLNSNCTNCYSAWSFGNGSVSFSNNPTTSYPSPGNYTICHTVSCFPLNGHTEPVCIDSVCHNIVINNCDSDSCVVSANFNFSIDGCTASFSDMSAYGPDTYPCGVLWDFDGLGFSTDPNPVFAFPGAGNYNVCLNVCGMTNDGQYCYSQICYTVKIRECCEKDCKFDFKPLFSYKTEKCLVEFTDQSTPANYVLNWFWTFGDGSSSTQQNPLHSYTAPGIYTVCLTVQATDGTDTCSFTHCLDVEVLYCEPQECKVKSMFSFVTEKCTVTFSDSSYFNSGTSITGWSWDFGDGNYSNQQNPVHNYAQPGTYTVCLTVYGTNGSVSCFHTWCTQVEIKDDCQPSAYPCELNADFLFTVNNCIVSLNALTTSGPGTTILQWWWDFGDGFTGNGATTTHTYSQPGQYNVCLKVLAIGSNKDTCTFYVCHCVIVKRCEGSDCKVKAMANYAVNWMNPCKLHFFNMSQAFGSTSIVAINWSFGDGTYSSLSNPVHVYSTPGIYEVCVEVIGYSNGQYCKDKYCFFVQVDHCHIHEACGVHADFSYNSDVCTFSFSNKSTSALNTTIIGYRWDFGDGSGSIQMDPVHTYGTPGTYTVSLTTYGLSADGAHCEEKRSVQVDCQATRSSSQNNGSRKACEMNMKLVPNPAGEQCTIQLVSPCEEEEVSLCVYSIHGYLIHRQEKIHLGRHPMILLETGDWAEGMYFVHVIGKQQSSVEKLMINH